MRRGMRFIATLALLPLAGVTACSSGSDDGGSSGSGGSDASGSVELNYVLWDSLQKPAYEQCAAAFTQENPGITVTITQTGWDDYWTNLQTNLVADTGPDVFTNHVAWFPQYAEEGQLLDLNQRVKDSGIDLAAYQDKLVDVWHGKEGELYGLPKDWDTIGLFYNVDMATEAGYTPEKLASLAWNPQDGGSYEKFLARMTVDSNGVRGDEPGFDKTKVATYGLGLNTSGAAFGQTEYSIYTLSNDWTYSDKNPWGTTFNYDDPAFIETVTWWRSLIEKGYMPSLEIAESAGGTLDPFGAGKYAVVSEGDWNANAYASLGGVTVGFAPTPIGPSGERASVFNGLADSIWKGTKHPDEAWKWVAFLGSETCQDIVASHAVVFPARQTSTDKAMDAFKAKGMDVSGFLVHVTDDTTHLPPIADNWSDVQSTMKEAMDAFMSFQGDAEVITKANEKVNALFG